MLETLLELAPLLGMLAFSFFGIRYLIKTSEDRVRALSLATEPDVTDAPDDVEDTDRQLDITDVMSMADVFLAGLATYPDREDRRALLASLRLVAPDVHVMVLTGPHSANL